MPDTVKMTITAEIVMTSAVTLIPILVLHSDGSIGMVPANTRINKPDVEDVRIVRGGLDGINRGNKV